MRQAGRWDPEFNRLRSGLSFYEFSENVDLAIKTSLLPRRFGVDAIILFYDITTLTVAMGLPFTLQPGKGPVPDRPIRTLQDVERLAAHPQPQSYGHVIKMLHGVKAELRGELPVLVFAGAPFTVATYCIGTGKDLSATQNPLRPGTAAGLAKAARPHRRGHGAFPAHADSGRGRRLPALRFLGGDADPQRI